MLKLCGSSSIKYKSKSFFRFLPLILLLGIAFCPQAQSGQANVAYFAGGCFWCTEAVFEQASGVTSVVSGYMQGARDSTGHVRSHKNQLRQTDQSVLARA